MISRPALFFLSLQYTKCNNIYVLVLIQAFFKYLRSKKMFDTYRRTHIVDKHKNVKFPIFKSINHWGSTNVHCNVNYILKEWEIKWMLSNTEVHSFSSIDCKTTSYDYFMHFINMANLLYKVSGYMKWLSKYIAKL